MLIIVNYLSLIVCAVCTRLGVNVFKWIKQPQQIPLIWPSFDFDMYRYNHANPEIREATCVFSYRACWSRSNKLHQYALNLRNEWIFTTGAAPSHFMEILMFRKKCTQSFWYSIIQTMIIRFWCPLNQTIWQPPGDGNCVIIFWCSCSEFWRSGIRPLYQMEAASTEKSQHSKHVTQTGMKLSKSSSHLLIRQTAVWFSMISLYLLRINAMATDTPKGKALHKVAEWKLWFKTTVY